MRGILAETGRQSGYRIVSTKRLGEMYQGGAEAGASRGLKRAVADAVQQRRNTLARDLVQLAQTKSHIRYFKQGRRAAHALRGSCRPALQYAAYSEGSYGSQTVSTGWYA
jgi:hypothetical protein